MSSTRTLVPPLRGLCLVGFEMTPDTTQTNEDPPHVPAPRRQTRHRRDSRAGQGHPGRSVPRARRASFRLVGGASLPRMGTARQMT
jgi:hypothetical protein